MHGPYYRVTRQNDLWMDRKHTRVRLLPYVHQLSNLYKNTCKKLFWFHLSLAFSPAALTDWISTSFSGTSSWTMKHWLKLYDGHHLIKIYPIAVGKMVTSTPMGTYRIINKQSNPGGPFGAFWMGLSKLHYGIHGTNNPSSIGKSVSHGCIRMHNEDVLELAFMVSIGTTVTIHKWNTDYLVFCMFHIIGGKVSRLLILPDGLISGYRGYIKSYYILIKRASIKYKTKLRVVFNAGFFELPIKFSFSLLTLYHLI